VGFRGGVAEKSLDKLHLSKNESPKIEKNFPSDKDWRLKSAKKSPDNGQGENRVLFQRFLILYFQLPYQLNSNAIIFGNSYWQLEIASCLLLIA